MKSALNFRNPDLWQGKSPAEMWQAFRDDIDHRIDEAFAPQRPNALVEIRSLGPRIEPGHTR